ncbi:hypothetical protein VTI28DRAFT_4700 [Corynascus sepedonium]
MRGVWLLYRRVWRIGVVVMVPWQAFDGQVSSNRDPQGSGSSSTECREAQLPVSTEMIKPHSDNRSLGVCCIRLLWFRLRPPLHGKASTNRQNKTETTHYATPARLMPATQYIRIDCRTR